MNEYMFVCPNCSSRIPLGRFSRKCPACPSEMVFTGFTKESWAKISEEKQEELVARILREELTNPIHPKKEHPKSYGWLLLISTLLGIKVLLIGIISYFLSLAYSSLLQISQPLMFGICAFIGIIAIAPEVILLGAAEDIRDLRNFFLLIHGDIWK